MEKKFFHPKGQIRTLYVLFAASTLLGFLGRYGWFFYLLSYFRVQLAFAMLFCSVAFAALRKWDWMVVGLVLALVNVAVVLPIYGAPSGAAPPAKDKLSVLLMNVRMHSQTFKPALALIDREKADVVALIETDAAWAKALKVLEKTYPYSKVVPNELKYGVALYSKFPLRKIEVQYYGGVPAPVLLARMRRAGRDVTFGLLHLVPPMELTCHKAHKNAIKAMIAARNTLGEDLVLLGDFNATPWCYTMKDLEAGMKLRNARQGFGQLPTWPVFIFPLWIPVDQCFVSEKVGVLGMSVRPAAGASDHYPLRLELGF